MVNQTAEILPFSRGMQSSNETLDQNNNNNTSDKSRPVRLFFGYFLIAIAGISLLGWAYIFYLRVSYSRKIKEEEDDDEIIQGGQGYIGSSQTCCKGNGMGVQPITLDTPPRSHSGGSEVPDDPFVNIEQQPPPPQRHSPNRYGNTVPSEQKSKKGRINDDDSFARELQIAARVDRHSWEEHENRKKVMIQGQHKTPSVHSSKRDVLNFQGSQGFDFFGWKNGWGGEAGNMNQNSQRVLQEPQSPKVSYLPTRLQSRPQMSVGSGQGVGNGRNFDNRRQVVRGAQGAIHVFPPHLEMNDSDPSDVILSDSSSTNNSSATSNSYAGKDSSVEEGEHDGENGFELIGYLDGTKDGMNEYLLNPIPASDDVSFGNASGMEMSLGAHTTNTNQTSSTQGRGSEGRGFYVIHEDNDLMHEYIPKEEYDAAVMAVTEVLKNSPRNSPRNSPQRARNETPKTRPREKQSRSFLSVPSDEWNSGRQSESQSLSEYGSNSRNPTNTHMSLDSSTTDSDSKLSKDIFNELKNVSAFIRRYEKKRSSKRANDDTQSSDNGYDTRDSSNDTSTFNSFGSQPAMTVTSASESDSAFQRNKTKRVRKPSFGRKKKHYAPQNDVGEFEVKVKAKKKRNKNKDSKSKIRVFPPRYPSRRKIGDMDDDDDEYDDDVIIISNPNDGSRSQRRQLPVAGNGEYPGIGMNPSGESAASDANFLRTEIESFFSHKDTSMSVMSESVEVLHRPTYDKSKAAGRTGQMHKSQPQSIPKSQPQSPVTSPQRTTTSELDGGNGRLGAAPFDPSEPQIVLDPYRKTATAVTPPSTVNVKEKKQKSLTPLASSKKDTLPVYGNSAVYSPRSSAKNENPSPSVQFPLTQSAKTMFQSGAKSIASIIMDRTRQNPKDEHLNSVMGEDIETGEFIPTTATETPTTTRNGQNKNIHEQNLNTIGAHKTAHEPNKSTFAGLETRLQNGARSLMSMFETKDNDQTGSTGHSISPPRRSDDNNSMSDRFTNRLEQIRRSVKYRTENISPSSSPKPRTTVANRENYDRAHSHNQVDEEDEPIVSRRVQVATFLSPEEMISPSSTHRVRRQQRTPGKLLQPDVSISQQSGDDTTESPNRITPSHRDFGSTNERPPISAVPAHFSPRSDRETNANNNNNNNNSGSTVGSTASNTRNLISIFESRRASSNGIFPPGEHWQYTGKLKPTRTLAR